MRFCTHCGAQVPDNAKFCTACGTPVNAPDEATVVISNPEDETVEASDSEGEFTAASWTSASAASPSSPASPASPTSPTSPTSPASSSSNRATPPPAGPQPESARPVQPVVKEAPESSGKGIIANLKIFLIVLAIAVLAVLLAVLLRGAFNGRRVVSSPGDESVSGQAPASRILPGDAAIENNILQDVDDISSDDDDDIFQSLDELSPAEKEEYLKHLNESSDDYTEDKAATVTVGGVKFLLAGDYCIASREQLQNGESCIIVPKRAKNQDNRLKLTVIPDALYSVGGLTSEELQNMLSAAVDKMAGELGAGKKYKIHFDDNAKGTYFPLCYTYLNFKNPRSGKQMRSYTEATLVNGNLLCGCAVATDEGEQAALTDIYSSVVVGATL